MRERRVRILATFFGTGYLPLAPGSWGALAGLLIYASFLRDNLFLHIFLLLIVTFLGFRVCAPAEKIFKKKDAGVIVIDEVAGILLSLLFIPSKTLYIFLAYFLFRLFDTIKPPPTDRIEELSGSYGIMFDDLIAGLYANICLHAIHFMLISYQIGL